MKNGKKGLWIGLGIALAIAAIGAAIIYGMTHKKAVPPDPAENREQAVAFVASKAFAEMPLAQQRAYVEKMRPPRGQRPPQQPNGANNGQRPPRPDENLTEEQRKAFHQNMRKVREAEMNERLDKFFAMSKEEQLADLDKRIAEHKARRANRPQRPPEQPPQQSAANTAKTSGTAAAQTGTTTANQTTSASQQRNQRWRPSAQDRRNHDEEFSPATRAKMSAYFQLMRLREQGKLK